MINLLYFITSKYYVIFKNILIRALIFNRQQNNGKLLVEVEPTKPERELSRVGMVTLV